MDLNKREFLNFEDLYEYCYCVASTVGLIFVSIIGYKSPETVEYAINLGVALQLTNILRDIKKDALIGRFYIPDSDLNLFDYRKDDILQNKYNDNFLNLMRFETNRAKSFYEKAHQNLKKVDYNTMLPARIMDLTYYTILEKIYHSGFDIYSHDFKLTKIKKLLISFRVFLNTKSYIYNE
jgi:phytoene synthase